MSTATTTAAAGTSIRAVREMAGLTLAEAARLVGSSPSYLSQVETGKAPNVTPRYIANAMSKLAEFVANPIETSVADVA
ncbi:helix-turn-helix transcriptional regulator [Pseudoclavibacter sp. CFCC 14310]|uniref:helix-turn-helix domain-containing protein n=1 Tax=Pseudoclavibacter sp. CFCC 14310 TaxID=2615180 RepID=UPI0013012D3F|nr:helix-turn-helix transcriptional regulator [Pseudoclavibacter sp. CFCC 14310]KAB1647501.1 helix-turn-helix transcriptional regulator [Pseudoclavibacter sp. CFCC 14310]